MGVKAEHIYIDDLREEFVRDFVFPMFRANALYEGTYLLGTSIARPLIAKRQIEIARETGADAVAHGATGKGNDQVRFELGYYALEPGIRVIAPWREWDLNSRTKLLAYARDRQIPIATNKQGEPPYSTDANLLHISYEGGAGGSVGGAGRGDVHPHHCAGERAGPADRRRDRLREGRPRGGRRPEAVAGGAADPPQTTWRARTASAAPTSWRTASSG